MKCLKQVKDFLKSKINYDVYLLAGNLRPPVKEVKPGILKYIKVLQTTGYIVKNHYFDKMINNIKEGINNLIRNPNNGYNAIRYWMKLQQS